MKRLILLLCLGCGLARAKDLEKHIYGLRSDNADVRIPAEKALINAGAAAVKALHEHYFTDIEQLLKDLGADSFRVRRRATEQLIALGNASRERVEALAKSTDDPEVKIRCEAVLKTVKKSGGRTGIREAMVVVIRIGADLPENRPFLERYLESFEKAEGPVKALLPSVVKLCRDDKLLTECLYGLKNGIDVYRLIAAWRAARPDTAQKIILEYERKLFGPGFDVNPIANSITGQGSIALHNIRDRASVLKAKGYYGKGQGVLIEKLLKLNDKNAHALGTLLAVGDAGPFADLIVSAMKSVKESTEPMVHFLPQVQNPVKLFSPHLEAFLQSPIPKFQVIGLDCCTKEPKRHNGKVARLFAKTLDPTVIVASVEILLAGNPNMRHDLRTQVVKKVQAIKTTDYAAVMTMAILLHGKLRYAGGDLDDWWAKWAKTKGLHSYEVFAVGLVLSVANARMAPLAADFHLLGDVGAEKFLKICSRTKIKADRTYSFMASIPAQNLGMNPTGLYDEFLLRKRPDSARIVIPAMLSRAATIKRFEEHTKSLLEKYSNPIIVIPDRAAVVRPFLKHENQSARYCAASILLKAFPKDKDCVAAIRRLKPTDDRMFSKAVLEDMFELELEFDALEPFLSQYFSSKPNKDKDGDAYILGKYLTPKFKDRLPYFHKILRNQISQGKELNALSIAQAILKMDTDDDAATKYVAHYVHNGKDPDRAANALYTLAVLRKEPELSLEVIERLYSKGKDIANVNSALVESEKNRNKALPIVKKYLAKNLDGSSGLGDLLWKNENYQRALTPGLVKALAGADKRKSERALRILTCGSCVLKNHLAVLKKVYAKNTADDFREDFMWMLANMGLDGAPFAEVLAKDHSKSKDDEKSHYLFAMSRISPSRAKRQAYLRQLIAHAQSLLKHSKPYRMIRLVSEFPEITYPVLRKALRDQKDEARGEGVWALIEERPFSTKTIAIFELLLRRCQEGSKDYDASAESLCWALRKRAPDAVRFLPLLEKADYKLKCNNGYRYLIHAIHAYQK